MESLRELLLGDNFSCPTCVCQCSTEVLDLSPPFGTFVRLWTSFPKRPARPPFRRRVVRGRQWPVGLPFPLRVCVCGPGEEDVLRALDRRSSTRSAVSRLCKASSPPPLRLRLRAPGAVSRVRMEMVRASECTNVEPLYITNAATLRCILGHGLQ